MKPKIVMKVEFIAPKTGNRFFDYIDRKDATLIDEKVDINKLKDFNTDNQILDLNKKSDDQRSSRTSYLNYMDRSKATAVEDNIVTLNKMNKDPEQELLPTFNKFKNNITVREKKLTKKRLKEADKNGCLMWSIVLSFDNDFLRDSNILKNNVLDQQELKTRVRSGMSQFLEANNFNDSAFYLANVHLNTENIHVHIALSETNSSRNKKRTRDNNVVDQGYFKKSMIRKGKTIFYKNIESPSQRIKELQLLKDIDLARSKAITTTKDEINEKYIKQILSLNEGTNDRSAFLLKKLYLQLPSNKALWRYKSNSQDFKNAKATLNKLIDNLIVTNPEYSTFKKLVDKQEDQSKKIYGENISKSVSLTKDQRVRSVIGNYVLKELKNIINDEPEIGEIEKNNKNLKEKYKTFSSKDISLEKEKIENSLKELKNNSGTNFLDDRKSYKLMESFIKSKNYLNRLDILKLSKAQKLEIDKQINNINNYIKKNKDNPSKDYQIKNFDLINANLNTQKIAINLKTLDYSSKTAYLKKLHLSPVQVNKIANQKKINQDLIKATDSTFNESTKVEDMIEQIKLQENLILSEDLEMFNIRTGSVVTPKQFKVIKKKQLELQSLKKKYIKNRYTYNIYNKDLEKTLKYLRQMNKNDPERKKIGKIANTDKNKVVGLLNDRLQIETKIYAITANNPEVANDALIGSYQKLFTKPNIAIISSKISKITDNEKVPEIKKASQKNLKNLINNFKLEEATEKVNKLNINLSKVLTKISQATSRQITNNKHLQLEKRVEVSQQKMEMEESQEEQVAQITAEQEEARAKQEEARLRRER